MIRFMTAILSTLVFASVFSWLNYVPVDERVENVYYFGFWETFLFVVIYAGPVYLLFGIPSSVIIDQWTTNVQQKGKFFLQLVLYGLFGFIGLLIFSIAFGGELIDYGNMILMGVSVAWIYFFIKLLLNRYYKTD
ncbi:hypothetical protein [Tenuibacillus multivorans]|uniref:Uncharacterized protein n=1 Tax=Tenuibacillus multivorans TaxID=237069 RepID=A0A1H0AYM3_9BACI|nr:hypothetical protein [Tenuibacillus multivorans]GEL77625.1 hypothetical protein TMU01_18600 [Tenuibacillus multivorans]SDN38143.1 hypothetical protein SAMN05216498_2123 [Tenuibacillus multivorans]